MILPGSRYAKAQPFTAATGRPAPFLGIRPRPIAATAGVIEHVVKAGDRLDLLARHYYNDDRLWWRIVDANPEVFYGGDLVRELVWAAEAAGGLAVLREEELQPTQQVLLASMVGRSIVIPRSRG